MLPPTKLAFQHEQSKINIKEGENQQRCELINGVKPPQNLGVLIEIKKMSQIN